MNSIFLRFSLFIFSLSIVIFSCTRIDTTTLGSELIPAVDNVNTFQAILGTNTVNEAFVNDSTRVFPFQDHALGVIDNDPEFGKTAASIYLALEPSTFGTYPFVNRDSVVIDSVVLSLAYKGLYGDSNSIQQIEVREIDVLTEFKSDSTYAVGSPAFPTNNIVLGSKMLNFNTLNDSVIYTNGTAVVRAKDQLRIHLDTSFGRKFVDYTITNEYFSDSAFKLAFKGFEIKVNEGISPLKNALAYFAISNTDATKLTFYCRVRNNGATDTISPSFIYQTDPNANLIRRTPGGKYNQYLTDLEPIDGDEEAYIQSAPGSYVKISIPGLDTFANTNRVIHLAELIIDKIPSIQDNIYPPPQLLFLDALGLNGDSVLSIRNDFIPEPPTSYDLSLYGGVLRNNRYAFNITRYVQSIVTNRFPNYLLRVHAPFVTYLRYQFPDGSVESNQRTFVVNPQVAFGRLVAAGGSYTGDQTKRLRLRIIYSNL